MFVLIALCTFATNAHLIAQQPAENTITSLGLHYGSLNYLTSTNTFDAAVASGVNIVVKIGAEWCGPCRQMEPLIVQLAQEMKSVLFIEVNLDSFKSLANRYGIRSIPAVLLFKNGSKIVQSIGYKDKTTLSSLISSSFGL